MSFFKRLFGKKEKTSQHISPSEPTEEPFNAFLNEFVQTSQDNEHVSHENFTKIFYKYIPESEFINKLWVYLHNGATSKHTVTIFELQNLFVTMLNLEHEYSQLDFYIGLFAHKVSARITVKDLEYILNIALSYTLKHFGDYQHLIPNNFSTLLCQSLLDAHDDSSLHKQQVCTWADKTFASIFCGLQVYLMKVISAAPIGISVFNTTYMEQIMSGLVTLPFTMVLACSLPYCFIGGSSTSSVEVGIDATYSFIKLCYPLILQPWCLLYSSDFHGLSLNRFEKHVFSYKGPTVMVICLQGKIKYAVACDSEWKASMQPFGSTNCTVIQLLPVYHIVQTGSNMFFYNTSNRSVPKGIQIGLDPQNRVLYIEEDMFVAFEYGIKRKIEAVEVWGCGGLRLLDEQKEQKSWEHNQTKKALNRKLKLDGESWSENPDRQILQLGGISTDHNKEQLHNMNINEKDP